MKLSILALFSLWLTVAAACAAETPVPTPTPTPTPTIEPPLKENLEPLIAYPDIGYQQADLEKWLKVIQEIGLEQHPGSHQNLHRNRLRRLRQHQNYCLQQGAHRPRHGTGRTRRSSFQCRTSAAR